MLLEFTVKTFGNEFFHHAWEDFFLGVDVPEDLVAAQEFEPMFVPWLVLGFVRDEESGAGRNHPEWPDQPIGLYWLEAAAKNTDIDEAWRAYIHIACRSPLSVFVVEAAEPGVSLDIKDVLTGRRFHVLEQSASRTLQPADLHFTRVVTMDGVSVMFGGAPLVVPPDWHTRIIDWREGILGKRLATRETLVDVELEVRQLYLTVADFVRNPPPPQVRNTDGDDLEPTQLIFDLGLPVAEAFEKLKPLAAAKDGDHIDDVTYDESGAMTSATLSWVKEGNRKLKQWTNTVLGSLVLAPGVLTADVNSTRRADRLIREIRRRLGKTSVLTKRTVLNMEEMLAERAHSGRATWHAKGVVVDNDLSFVTSANFTEWAQTRNVEAGVLVKGALFNSQLRNQVEGLVRSGLVVRVPGF